jgi:hypothetical protein
LKSWRFQSVEQPWCPVRLSSVKLVGVERKRERASSVPPSCLLCGNLATDDQKWLANVRTFF